MDTTVITIGATIAVGFFAWLTTTVLSNKTKVEQSLMNDASAEKQIQSIIKGMDDMDENIKESFKSLNVRLDTFLSNEIAALKQIADRK